MRDVAKDFQSLYDATTLQYWQTRYPENVRWNFENLLLQRLKPKENSVVRKVHLAFPLVDATPLEFYASLEPPTVTLPILSIKFIDDLSIASAWLELNDFSQETIMDYVAMVKYASPRRFAGSRFPPPLEALQIPDKIWEKDRQVDDLAQKILKSSLLWILAHELGHILFGHSGYKGITAKKAQQNEIEADSFATEMFRRIGTPPAGMGFLFVVFTHFLPNRGDYGSDRAWKEYVTNKSTHPLSTVRLGKLAHTLMSSAEGFASAEPNKAAAIQTVRSIGQKLEEIGRSLEDPGVQRLIRARAATVTVESLTPRRIGEVPVSGMKQFRVPPGTPAFHGVYTGAHKRRLAKGGKESLECVLVLWRKDDVVTGRFNFGVGEGTLSGRLINGTLHFEWEWGDTSGKGIFERKSDTEFSGHWGYDSSREDGGTWSGLRES